MQNSLDLNLFCSEHTFGRDHLHPPPLKGELQMNSSACALPQMGGANESMQQNNSLPDDFDHLIRSIGEW